MANIKKCDRCGKVYEMNLVIPKYNIYNRDIGEKVDLCESCQESFNKWFKRDQVIIDKLDVRKLDAKSINTLKGLCERVEHNAELEFERKFLGKWVFNTDEMSCKCGAKYSR